MITKLFRRPPQHEHAESTQRIVGASKLDPDSNEIAQLLTADPMPDVRAAAASHCANLAALETAWEKEADPLVSVAIASALVRVLSETADGAAASSLLATEKLTDAIRAEVAQRTQDADRREAAISSIRDQASLLELAISAKHAGTRMAAAERLGTPDALQRLAEAARNKDHGIVRLARTRIAAMENREQQTREADAILAELEALQNASGPILTRMVELNRRWQVLDMSGEAERLARCEAARRTLEARFDREHEEQRRRARFERRSREWLQALAPPTALAALDDLRVELAALREEARSLGNDAAGAELERAERRFAEWEQSLQAMAVSEALVAEAEQLAASTSIDHADLSQRWLALDAAIRAPAMTQRFEAAVDAIEQRRLAQIRVTQEEANAVRQRINELLRTADQAIASGQLQSARAAAEAIKAQKLPAGAMSKSNLQQLGNFRQQLAELERWESFGQHNARVQLCERAEALAMQKLDATRLAQQVRQLREAWKALDAQHSGVPKSLWERFDRACEKAYAPAAQHFAELAAQRAQARKDRDQFIAAASAQVATLQVEPCDWRAIERWLRDTDRAWRENNLGSLDPAAWKDMDARFKAALSPLRGALSAARDRAKADRQTLITEMEALTAKATEPGALSQVKALKIRWQEQAKALPLAQRDERALWERFCVASDAVFAARDARRKDEDSRKQQHRRALEELCAAAEDLARGSDKDEQVIRRGLRDLQEQWKQKTSRQDPAPQGMESRFRTALTALEGSVSAQARTRVATEWQVLAAKERLCDALDALVRSSPSEDDAATRAATARAQWAALPALPPQWEKKMAARRDAALQAGSDGAAGRDYVARLESAADARRESLLELEILLSLDSPPELRAQRLALQVKLLGRRFQGDATATAGAGAAGERLVSWSAQPGTTDARDRQRSERVFAKMERVR